MEMSTLEETQGISLPASVVSLLMMIMVMRLLIIIVVFFLLVQHCFLSNTRILLNLKSLPANHLHY